MRKTSLQDEEQTDDTDAAVIRALQCGDNAAVKRFYTRARDYFMKHVASVTPAAGGSRGQLAELPDLFQEAFIKVWTEITSLCIYVDGDGVCRRVDSNGVDRPMSASLLTFIMAVARNRSLELVRHNVIYGPGGDGTPEPAEHPRDTDTPAREQVVELFFSRLPPHCREILELFYYQHKSLDEIIDIRGAGQTKNGLKSAKSRCLSRLKENVIRYCDKLKI